MPGSLQVVGPDRCLSCQGMLLYVPMFLSYDSKPDSSRFDLCASELQVQMYTYHMHEDNTLQLAKCIAGLLSSLMQKPRSINTETM